MSSHSIAVALLATACGRLGFGVRPEDDATPAFDTSTGVDARVFPAFGPFADPTPATQLNSSVREVGPTTTLDEVWLTSLRMPGSTVLRADRSELSSVDFVTEFGNGIAFADPAIDDTGTEIYLDEVVSATAITIRRATRATPSDAWGPVEPVDELAGLAGVDLAVGALAMVAHRFPQRGLVELKRASRSSPWTVIRDLTELGATAEWGALREDGLELFYEQAGTNGAVVMVATRPSLGDAFGAPSIVDLAKPPGANDGDPDIDPLGQTLWFATDRPGGAGEFDIWKADRVPL